jgi:hypothetical protein
VYTTALPSDGYERLKVEIPAELNPFRNPTDEIVVEINGDRYLFSQVLCGDEFPHIAVPGVKSRYIMLRVLDYNA